MKDSNSVIQTASYLYSRNQTLKTETDVSQYMWSYFISFFSGKKVFHRRWRL